MKVKRLVFNALDVIHTIKQQARFERFINACTVSCIVLPISQEVRKALDRLVLALQPGEIFNRVDRTQRLIAPDTLQHAVHGLHSRRGPLRIRSSSAVTLKGFE